MGTSEDPLPIERGIEKARKENLLKQIDATCKKISDKFEYISAFYGFCFQRELRFVSFSKTSSLSPNKKALHERLNEERIWFHLTEAKLLLSLGSVRWNQILPGVHMRLGTWITVPHPSVVELLADQNFEWLCVDLEHSPVSRQDLQLAVSIIQNKGKKAFARIAANSHLEAKFPLDSGIDGIIVPMVNSAAEAQQAVKNCLYPPRGVRGVGLARAQKFGFGFDQHLEKNLKELEIFLQIEHVDAVRQIDEILTLKDVTGIFLGPYDLSGSMGIPGQFEHPLMKEAISTVARKTLDAGKFLGVHVIPPDYKVLLSYKDLGYNFIAFSIDTFFMGQKIKDELKAISL